VSSPSTTRKMLAIKHACERFEINRDLLVAALDRRDSRQCLDAFVELCTLHLEQTGGTLKTATYRGELTALRALVAERPALTLIHTQQETPSMSYEIETDGACPLCEHPGLLSIGGDGQFECHCSQCYDGTPDGPLRAQTVGSGKTAREAVADWIERAEAHLPEAVGYWPTDVNDLARAEFRRQAGWVQTVTEAGTWYAPELLGHCWRCSKPGAVVHAGGFSCGEARECIRCAQGDSAQ